MTAADLAGAAPAGAARPAPGGGERLAAAEYATGAAKAVILLAAAWHVLNDLVSTVAGGARPVALLVWTAYAAVGLAAARTILRGRWARASGASAIEPAPMQAVWAGAAVLLAGAGAMHIATDATAGLTFSNWAWSAAGWFAVLLWWRHRTRGFLLFQAANAALSFVVVVGIGTASRLDMALLLMVVYGTSALQLTVFAGGGALEAAVRRSARARDATEHVAAERQAADQAHAARRDRYAAARAAAEELLAGLADGRLDVDDATVRDRCAVASARLRRLVTETDDVPDPLVHDLRAAADVAERRGAAVTLDLVGEVPPMPLPVRRALADAPACAVAAAHREARITVVAAGGTVTVAVVGDADLDLSQTTRHDDVVVHFDRGLGEGAQPWVQTQWAVPSASPSSTTTTSSSTAYAPGPPPIRSTASGSS
jgi:hypothetical protein